MADANTPNPDDYTWEITYDPNGNGWRWKVEYHDRLIHHVGDGLTNIRWGARRMINSSIKYHMKHYLLMKKNISGKGFA